MQVTDLIAFLFPPVIDLINRKVSDKDARFWVSVAFCVIVGASVSYFAHGSTVLADAVDQIFVYIGLAQLMYKGIYEDSKVQKMIRGV